jgi:hypothetical protein
MTKRMFAIAVFGGLCFSSSAWALPQSFACRTGARAHKLTLTGGPPCALTLDPWQDCGDDPWQVSYETRFSARFADPWQDSVDPWQPFSAALTVTILIDEPADPWQPAGRPLVLRAKQRQLATGDDPWQPDFADPWQDAADPWQVP